MARSTINHAFCAVSVFFSLVKADGWGPGGNWDGTGNPPWNGPDGSGGPFWGEGGDGGGDGDGSGTGSSGFNASNGFGLGSLQNFDRATNILIAHAVIASLVWVMFIPTGAILLRVNLKNPIILKLHAIIQVLSYLLFLVAAGMGIWLARQTSRFGIWNDPHPKLGLAILAIATFMPILGAVHHRIFKKRAVDMKAGKSTKVPGRTVFGRMHVWTGRVLIVAGIVNGGLGIRLASFSPFQTDSTTRKAKIAYGVAAGAMFALYACLVIIFEIRRRKAQNNVPVQGARGTAHQQNMSKLP